MGFGVLVCLCVDRYHRDDSAAEELILWFMCEWHAGEYYIPSVLRHHTTSKGIYVSYAFGYTVLHVATKHICSCSGTNSFSNMESYMCAMLLYTLAGAGHCSNH